jgi:hypothetical protein
MFGSLSLGEFDSNLRAPIVRDRTLAFGASKMEREIAEQRNTKGTLRRVISFKSDGQTIYLSSETRL